MTRERGPSLKKILHAIDLAKITAHLRPCYKKWKRGDGQIGRPPINPVALTVTLLFSLLKGWHRNDLTAFLQRHAEWRRWLELDTVPDDSTWSKFLDRIGDDRIQKLFQILVDNLQEKGIIGHLVVAVDGSFIPGCHWDSDSKWGYVRRNDKRDLPTGSYLVNKDGILVGKGYRVHAMVDANSELPLVLHLAPANVNDAEAWPELFNKSRDILDWDRVGWLTGDKGYDSAKVRSLIRPYGVKTAIPAAKTPSRLPAGYLKGQAKKIYKKRTSVERFFSLLKRFFCLRRWGVVGIKRVRRWMLLAACAILVLAAGNHALGLPLASLKGFKRHLL